MRIRLLLVMLLVAGGLVFVLPGRAEACSCAGPPSFEKAVRQADAVFVGEVTSSRSHEGPQRFLGFRSDELVGYTFAVDEVVTGEVGASVEVVSHYSEATCGFPFQEGDRYVVFADQRDGRLETYLCSRTEAINETVSFGGETPVPERQVGPPIVDGNEARSTVIIVGAALIGFGALAFLAQRLLPRRR
jgi:hypothetical protein